MVLERVTAVLRASVAAVADDVEAFEWGFVARTPSLPAVWTLNQVHFTGSATAKAITSAAARHQAALSFRHVTVERLDRAEATTATLQALGWWVWHEVVMVMTSPVGAGRPRAGIVELSEDQALDLLAQWFTERRGATSGLADVLAFNRREGRHWGDTRYGVVGDDGSPVAVTKLRMEEGIGWIEDVYTVPTARRRGHARMLVEAAVADAWDRGAELVFLVADDDDWPKELYAGIGFAPIALHHSFHLDSPEPATAVREAPRVGD